MCWKTAKGIHEVEGVILKLGQAGAIRGMEMRVRSVSQSFCSQADHLVRNINAADFSEVPARWSYQSARTAADLERSPSHAVGLEGQPDELSFEHPKNIRGGCLELGFILIARSERNLIVRVLARRFQSSRIHSLTEFASGLNSPNYHREQVRPSQGSSLTSRFFQVRR